ncbi:MAG: acyl--CoA ligase family protein [Acidimicrobiales bacterium]
MTEVFDTPLSPLSFLERSAMVFPNRSAIRYRDRTVTYEEMAGHATRLARALQAGGIEPGDRVAYLCPNLPEMLIAHFGVPLGQGVLVAINTRLGPEEIRYILEHSGARILVGDTELLAPLAGVIGDLRDGDGAALDEVVAIVDDQAEGRPAGDLPFATTPYEDLLARGSDEPLPWVVDDEQRMISINYTSGTTGRPKGVMYSHRGAYLNAIAELTHSRHSPESVYLWTLPMFHCNGWCTTWGVTALGGTHVALRAVDPEEIWSLIQSEGVTHLNGAPTVLISLANSPAATPLDRPLVVTTAGAPPSPTVISDMTGLGAQLVHVYGLTETYGPHTVCEVQDGWADETPDQQAELKARQGVSFFTADPTRVVDAEMHDVPKDGETMGEVVMRGNNVMKGYYRDPDATAAAFTGGWFHSGDLAVWHPDGYIELRDRAKDIIISGGENISTIEVEQAVDSHDAVLESAVVAVPHETWGERPKAYAVLKPDASVTPDELKAHVRDRLAGFKVPDEVEILDELPKTSTGKVQKFVLREGNWKGHTRRIN